jgi:predicted nucleotidyltransferase
MITRSQIEEFARRIAEEFRPERIILFGSYAYGTPTEDSDIDLLVIMPTDGKSRYQQAADIYSKCRAAFPVDLIVRTPEEFQQRQQMRDWFIRDVAREGVTLYAA